MNNFLQYFDLEPKLAVRLKSVYQELRVSEEQRRKISAFLHPIKVKDKPTYEHSIRVGLLSSAIGKFMHLDPKVLLYAGLLHDVGKAQTRLATLKKTDGWTDFDSAEIIGHVMDGYRLIRDCFDFSAEIILWHHRFQLNGYPQKMPEFLHAYSEGTKVMICMYGRMLALADTFDALHRVNDKHGSTILDGKQIKEKMFVFHPDQKVLLEELFKADILTTRIV